MFNNHKRTKILDKVSHRMLVRTLICYLYRDTVPMNLKACTVIFLQKSSKTLQIGSILQIIFYQWTSWHFIFQVADMKRRVGSSWHFIFQVADMKRRVWSSWHFIFQVADMKRVVWGVACTLYFKLLIWRETSGE